MGVQCSCNKPWLLCSMHFCLGMACRGAMRLKHKGMCSTAAAGWQPERLRSAWTTIHRRLHTMSTTSSSQPSTSTNRQKQPPDILVAGHSKRPKSFNIEHDHPPTSMPSSRRSTSITREGSSNNKQQKIVACTTAAKRGILLLLGPKLLS